MRGALVGLLLTATSAGATPSRFPLHPLSVELGVRVVETTDQLRKSLGIEGDHGVLVTEVRTHGPADRGGLRAGDVVTVVAGQPVASTADVLDALEDRHAGDEIAVEYVRKGAPATTHVTLARA